VFALAIIADTWPSQMPIRQAPALWNISPAEISGALIVFPLGDPDQDVMAMYRNMTHGRPLVNGYSGNFPSWYNALQVSLTRDDPEILDELAMLGVTQIAVDSGLDRDGTWSDYALTRGRLVRADAGGAFTLYDLTPPASRTSRNLTAIVPIASIRANIGADDVSNMTDGDLITRWSSGPQMGSEIIWLDLGTPQDVAGIRLTLGPSDNDYPRELVIETSDDQDVWTEVWRGGGGAAAFSAALRRPTELSSIFDIGERRTRYIRLRQIGIDDTFYWSIAEIAVLAVPR
jgi:hypothetical protein